MKLVPEKTRAILIGNGTFPKWRKDSDIPNVKANIEELQYILHRSLGIPKDNITVFPDKKLGDILPKFQKVCQEYKLLGADSTLIVYYAGHGIPLANDGLYWATQETEEELIKTTALPSKSIKELLEDCAAKSKILIADCCYAADFLKGTQTDINSFLGKNEVNVKGVFYMFSSDGKNESLFDINNPLRPTYFTQALVEAIEAGQDCEYEYLTIGQLYELVISRVRELCTSEQKKIPEPSKRTDGNVDHFIFCKNSSYKPRRSPDEIAWAEIIIDKWIDSQRIEKIKSFISTHPTSEHRGDAIQMLLDYESAEQKFKNVRNLTQEERKTAYLVFAKDTRYLDLMKRAMKSYELEDQANEEEMSDKNRESNSIREGSQSGIRNSAPRAAGPNPNADDGKL